MRDSLTRGGAISAEHLDELHRAADGPYAGPGAAAGGVSGVDGYGGGGEGADGRQRPAEAILATSRDDIADARSAMADARPVEAASSLVEMPEAGLLMSADAVWAAAARWLDATLAAAAAVMAADPWGREALAWTPEIVLEWAHGPGDDGGSPEWHRAVLHAADAASRSVSRVPEEHRP